MTDYAEPLIAARAALRNVSELAAQKDWGKARAELYSAYLDLVRLRDVMNHLELRQAQDGRVHADGC